MKLPKLSRPRVHVIKQDIGDDIHLTTEIHLCSMFDLLPAWGQWAVAFLLFLPVCVLIMARILGI